MALTPGVRTEKTGASRGGSGQTHRGSADEPAR
jgi:hypothetical protein